jgi:peptide/nickel transport system substrate-binding protein
VPLANDAGIEVMTAPRDYDKVKRDIAKTGTVASQSSHWNPADIPELHAVSLMGIDMLRRAGSTLTQSHWTSAP